MPISGNFHPTIKAFFPHTSAELPVALDYDNLCTQLSSMLGRVRSCLPGLQPTLRAVSSNSGIASTRTNRLRSFQAQGPTARLCSSTSELPGDDMTSKHLETSHQRIFDNNRKWVDSMKAEDPEFFVKLGAGQEPEYLFVLPLVAHFSLHLSSKLNITLNEK